MKVGTREFKNIVKEKQTNPNISLKELQNKYGNMKLLNTDKYLNICMYRIEYPEYTLQNIGDKTHVCREYVRQVLKQMNLPTKHKNYGSIISKIICPKCGGIKTYRSKYCKKCTREFHYEFVQCEICQKPIERRIQYTKYMKEHRGYQHTWCSKSCQGKWLGKNHR